ncbi:MAG: rRNA adenine dimethyltransferase family protein [Verrucomicrobiales bacterium]|nr:rRNA adenine dimethyltransferase family protein [Verrucomicrobiales bacterium]
MTLTEMRSLLAKRDIQLTRSLGQNFLHDGNQLRRIVDAAELTPPDNVLEIGPGLGPLTELLVEKAGEVLAIEMDARLVEVLCERFGLEKKEGAPALSPAISPEERENISDASVNFTPPDLSQRGNENPPLLGERAGVREDNHHPDNLFLIHDDALAYLKREARDWSDWKLVANLPYSVASPILVELAAGPRAPKLIVATLQLEVAKRLMAQADDDDYGILTLLVQIDFEPRGSFKIPPECFFPSPDVDSACVCLVRRATPLLPENLRATFVKIVKRGFSQRRKMMLKLLKQDWPKEKLAAAFAALNISPMERAEKLTLEQFVALTEKLFN